MMCRDGYLQSLCRIYLRRLRYMGIKHGIDVDAIIRANKRNECSATAKEVEMLSRCVDDERVSALTLLLCLVSHIGNAWKAMILVASSG